MDPLPEVFALLSKHTDTSSNGKPLQNAQWQLTDCLIHIPVHFPIHCTVFACTIYAGKKKTQEMKCNVQATPYLLAAYSHTQKLGSVLFSQKQGKIWEGFLVKWGQTLSWGSQSWTCQTVIASPFYSSLSCPPPTSAPIFPVNLRLPHLYWDFGHANSWLCIQCNGGGWGPLPRQGYQQPVDISGLQ